MTDDHAGNLPRNPPISVSPDNPCPFLRAIVSEGYVGSHNVPLGTLAQTVQAASGKTGGRSTACSMPRPALGWTGTRMRS